MTEQKLEQLKKLLNDLVEAVANGDMEFEDAYQELEEFEKQYKDNKEALKLITEAKIKIGRMEDEFWEDWFEEEELLEE